MGYLIVRDIDINGIEIESFGKTSFLYNEGQFVESPKAELRIKSNVGEVSPRVDVFDTVEEAVQVLTTPIPEPETKEEPEEISEDKE